MKPTTILAVLVLLAIGFGTGIAFMWAMVETTRPPEHPRFSAEAGMTRHATITRKIDREVTGLRGSCFVRIEHDGHRILAVSMSEKGKENGPLDKLLTAMGDAITEEAEAMG